MKDSLEPVRERDEPGPFGHVLRGELGVADEVVEAEVITGLEAVLVPFEATSDSPLDIGTDDLVGHAVVWGGRYSLTLEPGLGRVAQMEVLEVHIVILRQTDMELRSREEEEIELFPQRNGIVRPDGDGEVMLQHAMGDIFGLDGRHILRAPMLFVPAIDQRIEKARLETETKRQLESESSSETDAMEVHIGERDIVRTLPMLHISRLNAVLNTKDIRFFLLLLFRRVEEGVISYLIGRQRFVIRPQERHANERQKQY